MNLFKRLIKNLLPIEIWKNDAWPASIFLSFISSKQFFSVISRKVIENHKIHMFDVGLDSYESDIWFQENPFKIKMHNMYYSYINVANLNGYTMYSPWNIWTALSIVIAQKLAHKFPRDKRKVWYYFLMTVYLMTYIFACRIKVFPYSIKDTKNSQKNFSWFIKVFFSMFELAARQWSDDVSKQDIEKLKQELLQELEVFFMLYRVFQKIATIYQKNMNETWFYTWMFNEWEKDIKTQHIVDDFIKNHSAYTKIGQFNKLDEVLLQIVLPNDILIKYIYHSDLFFPIIENTLWNIYNHKTIDWYLIWFLKDSKKLDEFLTYILDYKHLKRNFFSGMQETIRKTFRLNADYSQEKEIDEFISQISEWEKLEPSKMPEILKKESQLTEKLLNFYLSFIWGLFVWRGDSFHSRLLDIPVIYDNQHPIRKVYNKEVLHLYGKYILLYSETEKQYIQAHKNIAKNIIKKKTKSIDHIQTNIAVIYAAQEMMSHTIYSPYQNKQLELFVSNKKIVACFTKLYKSNIEEMLYESKLIYIQQYFKEVESRIWVEESKANDIHTSLVPYLSNLKDSMYQLDTWVLKSCLEEMNLNAWLSQIDERIKLYIAYMLQETLFWFILRQEYAYQKSVHSNQYRKYIQNFYIDEVLCIPQHQEFKEAINNVLSRTRKKHSEILSWRIELDDNKDFFEILWKDTQAKITAHDNETQNIWQKQISISEILRLKNYFQNITYYNKRTIII